MSTPSASGLERAFACPTSEALPQVDGVSSEAAERGTIGHAFLEEVGKRGGDEKARDAVLKATPEDERDWLSEIDIDGLPLGPGYQQEVALAFDPRTGIAREVGRSIKRAYKRNSPSEIFGTADVLHSEWAEIHDYKFDGYDSTAPKPEENPQLLFLALAAVRLRNRTGAQAALIHIRTDGTHWEERAEFDLFDLDAFAADLVPMLDRIEAARQQLAAGHVPDVRRGPWCRWCKAFAHCPGQATLVRSVIAAPESLTGGPGFALTTETAAAAWERIKAVRTVLDTVEASIRDYARIQPVPLAGGVELREVQQARESVDGAVARKVLTEQFGAEAADAATEFKSSKAAIERALGKKGKEAIAAIRAAGGIKEKCFSMVKEHRTRQ